jgi:polysaccharide export outer membrane protein
VSRITVENRNAREVEALVLQATVHVAVLTPGKSAEGLGTVIMEDEQGTLILTDAHLFENREKTREDSTVRPTRVRITQSMIHRSVEGELLDADHERDVALVRTWAPGLLPFARVERTNWEPVQDLPLIAVSVSAAGELGSRRTTVLLSDSRFTTEIVNKPAYRGLVCQGEAASGNAGAGLFTDYGELVGVCNYNTINSKSSMYASLESIRHLLARNHIRQEVQTHTLERIETLTREEPEVSRDSAKAVVSTKADASMKPDASTKEDLPREGRTRVMPAYVIEPPDLLIVEVPKSPDNARITGERLVRPDGSISLGGYGDVVVSGLTVKQAKAKIVALLRTYLDGDQLGLTAAGPRGKRIELAPEDAHGMFVDVAAYNSKVYYVQGAVASPGRFPITGNETVLDAINYAGGLSRSPKESQVFLIRPKAEGEGSTRLVVDFAAIIHGDAATNFQILPRDRLLVVAPEKVNADTAKPAMPEFERRLRAVEDKLEQILERLPGEPATPKK